MTLWTQIHEYTHLLLLLEVIVDSYLGERDSYGFIAEGTYLSFQQFSSLQQLV